MRFGNLGGFGPSWLSGADWRGPRRRPTFFGCFSFPLRDFAHPAGSRLPGRFSLGSGGGTSLSGEAAGECLARLRGSAGSTSGLLDAMNVYLGRGFYVDQEGRWGAGGRLEAYQQRASPQE